MRDRVLTQTVDNDVKGRNLTTFPSLPSDRETSGSGPARQSGHFNYKKQRRKGKGGVVGVGVGAAWMVVAVYLFVWGSFVCVCGGGGGKKKQRRSGKLSL